MSKIAKLKEEVEKDFWILFFKNLIKNYVHSETFFEMFGTISLPFDNFKKEIHKAYQETLEELDEISDPSLQDWLLSKKLKSRVVQYPKTNFLKVSDTIIISLRNELKNRQLSNKDSAKLWDKGSKDNQLSEELEETYSYVEIQENKVVFKAKIENRTENEVPIAFFKTASSAEETSIEVSEELSSIINSPVQEKLLNSYKLYRRSKEIQNTASDRYSDFKKEIIYILRNTKNIPNVPREIRELLEKLKNHSFKGYSFPSFPGLISVGSCSKFLNLQVEYDLELYGYRIFGEGWNKEKTILPSLLLLQEKFRDLHNTDRAECQEFLESLESKLFSYTSLLELDKLRYQDFEELFGMLRNLVNNNKFPEHDYYLSAEKKPLGKTKKIIISPKRIRPRRLVVFIHENNVAKDNKKNIANQSSIWIKEKKHGLQEFITYLIANTEFYPEEVLIFHKRIKADLREKINDVNNRFFAVIKSVIDSAILYLKNDPEIKKSFTRLNHEFRHLRGGDNIWFIPFLLKPIKSSLFHDYYYMVLKGVHSWESRYFENSQGFLFESLTQNYKEEHIKKIVRKLWKNKVFINRSRRRINVQLMTQDGFRKKGNIEWRVEKIKEHFKGPFPFYTFEKTGKIDLWTYETSQKEKRIALPDLYLSKFLSNYKDLSKAIGRLFMDKWYYTAHSLKNTSTAGYTLKDKITNSTIETTELLLLSLSSERWIKLDQEEIRYIRNIAIYAHLSDQREINFLEENFIEDSFGLIGCDANYEIAKLAISELSKENVTFLIREKHSSKTEKIFQNISEIVEENNFKTDDIKEPNIVEWVYARNKKLQKPLFILNEKVVLTPAREIGKLVSESKSNRLLTLYIDEPMISQGKCDKKFVGMLIFGSRREEKLEREIKKDLQPSLIFTIVPIDTSSKEIVSQLREFSKVLTCYGDEKGGTSIESLKRLFHLPYPDSVKLLDPSIFIKGINRIKVKEELI